MSHTRTCVFHACDREVLTGTAGNTALDREILVVIEFIREDAPESVIAGMGGNPTRVRRK